MKAARQSPFLARASKESTPPKSKLPEHPKNFTSRSMVPPLKGRRMVLEERARPEPVIITVGQLTPGQVRAMERVKEHMKGCTHGHGTGAHVVRMVPNSSSSGGAGGSKRGYAAPPRPWTCRMCTYFNESNAGRCDMCGTARGGMARVGVACRRNAGDPTGRHCGCRTGRDRPR